MHLKSYLPEFISLILFVAQNVFFCNTLVVEEVKNDVFGIKECGSTEWQCPNTTRCVSISNLCDGYVDCENGDDESRMLCTKVCYIIYTYERNILMNYFKKI